eukprot:gnl/MRDRNA2_/MRDRNA2_153461_c0_seq1.p1 gnl/MRDRNA2_/MRDRNA2_153461_c0~~gnl/MRDRNA2_/MRDRNA2_153461_c0_seq1.p1  ORF type:complete len:338 (+),score=55.90 gnl/MRDRNA2_/MRDRNA2_153461_c0_seq1:72-1016(+)
MSPTSTVSGSKTIKPEKSFDTKAIDAMGARAGDHGIGFACRKGSKTGMPTPNQDDFLILHSQPYSFFGVFDGHGKFGHTVSHFIKENLAKLLIEKETLLSDPLGALSASFVSCQELIKSQADAQESGSTATMVIRHNNELHCAHVGDSRAVLAEEGDSPKQYQAVELTRDHKPEDETERKRIEACGGELRADKSDVDASVGDKFRIYKRFKKYPGLAMSRALGDVMGATAGISCEPDVKTYPITPRSRWVIVCSDGVWEFLSSQEAVDIVSSYSRHDAHSAAETLAKQAWDKWIAVGGGLVVDDITVLVVWLGT